jgi:hypothetical protein
VAASPSDLELLARLYGVQTSYQDAMGGRQAASPESLLAVLQALDAPLEGPGDVAEALRARQDELDRQLVEPVVVAWDGVVPELDLRPGGQDGPLALHLDLEEGGRRAWTAPPCPPAPPACGASPCRSGSPPATTACGWRPAGGAPRPW